MKQAAGATSVCPSRAGLFGSANNAWTSSVYNSTNFGNVNNNGTPNNNNANNSYVPALGFQAGQRTNNE